jgi:hypothetical protein
MPHIRAMMIQTDSREVMIHLMIVDVRDEIFVAFMSGKIY